MGQNAIFQDRILSFREGKFNILKKNNTCEPRTKKPALLSILKCAWKPRGSSKSLPAIEGILGTPSSLAPFQASASIVWLFNRDPYMGLLIIIPI